MKKNIKNNIIRKIQGFSLIELIVAIAIFSILASGVVYVFTTSYKNFFGVGDKQVMVQFAQEGMEAVRSIRDNDWQTIVDAADGSDRGVQKNNIPLVCGEYSVTSNFLTYGTVEAADSSCWLDKNIGASRVAQASDDAAAYGYLYQWGRSSDVHQITNYSGTTATLSSSDTPNHPDFITASVGPYDWRSSQNDNLWQGVNGTNNVCPTGFRVPTRAEWTTLLTAENITSIATAYSSSLKLTVNGYRDRGAGTVSDQGTAGNYWSSTVSGTDAGLLYFDGGGVAAPSSAGSRAYGLGVRCVKAVASPCGETVSSNSLNYGTVAAADGNCWLDRNIGATRVAQASNDTSAYGYLYQWGRSSDGHHLTPSNGTTATLSSSDTPNHPDFITASVGPYDWRSSQNDNLWQGVNGTNNVCPTGFRVPTRAEWTTLLTAENITSIATAYSSVLKLTLNGYRERSNGNIAAQGSGGGGNYWSSTVSGTDAGLLYFDGGGVAAPSSAGSRAYGLGVRCILEDSPASSGFSWQFSGTSNTLNALTRVIVVSDVQRNSAGSIVVSGGTDDPDTKKVTVTVSGAGIADYVLTTFLTNSSAKTWEQTDWSGTSSNEFWASMVTASSSYSNISTSTVGQVSLSAQSASNGSFGAWADLAPEVYIGLTGGWPTNYAMDVSPDGDTLYACGGSGLGISAFDISNVRENKINLLWNMAIAEEIYSCKVHPNGHYAYLGRGPFSDGSKFIQVIDLYTQSIVQTVNTTDVVASNRVMDIVINSAQTKLLATSAYGGLHSFSLSADGATLTGDLAGNSAQANLVTSAWQQWGTTPHNMWLDESGGTPYLYVTTDNSAYAISKWNISNPASVTLVYKYIGSGSANDLAYLGNSGSGNTFAIATEETGAELKTLRDNGSGFTLLDTFDPGTFGSPGLIYDGSGAVIIYSTTEANMYAVNVADPSNITAIVSDTSTYAATMSTWPHHYAKYVSHQGGFFFLEYNSTGYVFRLNFIARPETRPTPTSFSYQRKITIDDAMVQNGPHTSFPVLISESQDFLKTVSNGGRIQSAKGHDILFTASDQITILDHEIETYSSSTGQLEAWVRIPSLPSDADTEIYMFYGNSSITTPMERVSSVWDSDFQVVQHMNDLTTINVASTTKNRNSKFNTNDATKYASGAPLQSIAKVGYGQTYDASYDYHTITNHADNQQGTNDFTVEFWIKPDSTATDYSCPIYKGNGNGTIAEGWNIRHYQGTTDKLDFMMGSGSVDLGNVMTANALTNNIWTHIVLTADRDVGYRFYVNGVADNSYSVNSSAYPVGTANSMYIGRDWSPSAYFLKSSLDEVRVSKTLRSADWIKTGYNNMNSTSTFYSIGSENNAGLYNSPGSIVSSIIDLGSSDKVLDSIKIFQSVPTSCALSLALEGSNNTSFSGYTSEVFSDSSTPNFTSSTPDSLNNLRYFRYRLNLTACNSNSQTPSLYSLRLNYR